MAKIVAYDASARTMTIESNGTTKTYQDLGSFEYQYQILEYASSVTDSIETKKDVSILPDMSDYLNQEITKALIQAAELEEKK